MNKQDKILKLLVEEKLISQEQLEEAEKTAEVTKKPIEDILLKMNVVEYEDLVKIKARAYNMLYENLADKRMTDRVLSVIPLEVAENYKIICFDKAGSKIKVGITDPNNFKAMEAVNFLAKEEGLSVEYYLISDISFNIAFKQYKTLKKEISTALKTRSEEEAEEVETKKKDDGNLESIVKTAPVAKIVSVIIRHAFEGRASDIHIEPMRNETRVRYRIDGMLRTSLILPKNVHNAIVGRIKVMANLKLDETRIPQDGRIRMVINGKEVDLRVSTLPLLGEEKVVMRILDTTKKILALKELGFISPGLEIIERNIKKTDGMFLVTGPTGSGKSTTLFAILNKINKEEVNISTLEDPVEYFVKGVNQSQVNPEIGFNFSSGLRSLLRQDPDIIMVGEIRDNETAELAIHAGLTGHFVLSTLHTNDAVGAIPRFLDMKVEPFLLASTLNTVVAQRLLRKICPHCKEEEKLPSDVLLEVKEEVKKIPPELFKEVNLDINPDKLVFYGGKGCSHCGNSGYSGRVVIAEVIDITDGIKEIIMDETRALKVEDVIEDQKFITMKQDSIIKVLLGLTSMEEVLRVLYD